MDPDPADHAGQPKMHLVTRTIAADPAHFPRIDISYSPRKVEIAIQGIMSFWTPSPVIKIAALSIDFDYDVDPEGRGCPTARQCLRSNLCRANALNCPERLFPSPGGDLNDLGRRRVDVPDHIFDFGSRQRPDIQPEPAHVD